MPPTLKLNSVAYISPQNHPILIRTYVKREDQATKYHYIAHTSLDVIEERGLLFCLEDVAVYGYITPLKVKIVVALPLSDSVVKDAEISAIFKALHMAYYKAASNPFLKLDTDGEVTTDPSSPNAALGKAKWKSFQRHIDEISRAVGNVPMSL
ncbi:hypothetical protein CVT24_009488 [Panaeolus cyanescens]|uniref:Trafficking protein particle complex subunit 2-like protein n=1 Tax=Panaeolus cyanescens TaxID=181874 RepID=A0A409VAF8_9AGAR|nr:hypothetical protein CVT24_009488 [Panaeolus cyanescens]